MTHHNRTAIRYCMNSTLLALLYILYEFNIVGQPENGGAKAKTAVSDDCPSLSFFVWQPFGFVFFSLLRMYVLYSSTLKSFR